MSEIFMAGLETFAEARRSLAAQLDVDLRVAVAQGFRGWLVVGEVRLEDQGDGRYSVTQSVKRVPFGQEAGAFGQGTFLAYRIDDETVALVQRLLGE